MPIEPRCPMCAAGGEACAFHTASNPQALARALGTAISRRGAIGLAQAMTAAVSRLEGSIPSEARALLARLDTEPLQDKFGELLEEEGWTAEQLRMIAGQALALAAIVEAQGEHGGGRGRKESGWEPDGFGG